MFTESGVVRFLGNDLFDNRGDRFDDGRLLGWGLRNTGVSMRLNPTRSGTELGGFKRKRLLTERAMS